MTGYRDEDSTYKKYDLETIQGELTWKVRIYYEGLCIHICEHRRKKEAYNLAKQTINKWLPNDFGCRL